MSPYSIRNFSVTADVVAFAQENEVWLILLIQRKHEPCKGQWALPGGFVEEEEDILDAARRELLEETTLAPGGSFIEVGVFGKPHRDPRGRVITIAYAVILPVMEIPQASSDAQSAQWFRCDDLPSLAFDHAEIIATAINKVIKQ
jgi:8-oxo-dGTP diphosphatase